MTERDTFDLRLAGLFGEYADRAPVDADAGALASAIARQPEQRLNFLGRSYVRPRWLVPALLALLLLASLAAAAIIGSRLLMEDIAPYQNVITDGPELADEPVHPMVTALSDTEILVLGNGNIGQNSYTYDLIDGSRSLVGGYIPSGEKSSSFVLSDGRVFALVYDGASTRVPELAMFFEPSSNAIRQLPFGPGAETGFAPIYGVQPSAALLHDGRVLIGGGIVNRGTMEPSLRPDALIFDPQTETFTPTGMMSTPRLLHSMTTLKDGRVLVAGGFSTWSSQVLKPPLVTRLNTAEIYDPATGMFSAPMTITDMWGEDISALLPDGRVVMFSVDDEIMGDQEATGPFPVVAFDPHDNTFATLGFMLERPQTATALRDGRVLLTGASYGDNQPVPDLPWARIFDPRTGELTPVAGMKSAQITAAALPGGDVVLAGGPAGTDREPVPLVQIFK